MAGARPITEAAPRFCAQCGTRLPASARFCPSCGEGVGAPARRSAPARSLRDQLPGLVVLAFFLSAGLAIWISVLQPGTPTATAPRGPGGAAPGSAAAGANVPPSHPPMQLPDEAKKFVDSLVARAEAAPNDAAAWRTLAQVQARASEIDSSYGPKAIESFQRVLTIAPGDPDAIRGLGNLYYDQQQYGRAAEQYEKYLQAKPDDASVSTDLATTYLYEGQVDRAIETYKNVIGAHPEFLQAHFNLGLAYEAKGDRKQALASLAKARSLADDEPTRTRIDRVTAQLESGGATVPGSASANAGAADASAPGSTGTVAQNVPSGTSAGASHGLPAARGGGHVAGAGAAGRAAGDLTGAADAGRPGSIAPGGGRPGSAPPAAAGTTTGDTFQHAVENALRAHQILGPKITAIDWSGPTAARVSVVDFPMDAMPDFARNLFRARLETILDDAKTAHAVSDGTSIELVDPATGKTMERVTH